MGGGRRAPFGAGEREKALEAVRAVTQPKVCTLYHQAQGVKLRLIQAPMRLNFSLW